MDCSTIKPVVGCWSKADGSFESVSIHYEYATAASGEPIVKSTRYTKADGGDIITVPAGDTVTVGACSAKWVTEKACYGTGAEPPLATELPLATDVLFDANTGSPLGAAYGATSASDSYLHAMYGIANGNTAGDFNADDATTPFDCGTHGGILLTDVTKVQAVTNAAVAAIEVADGVPAGTYKATYYLTLTNQAVWAYNAALAAVVANSTYLHPYTGPDATFCNYQEKHDINVASAFTEADLAIGKFPIEITKLISSTGDILQRRVWDDRTEPPTEIVGFDPLKITDSCKTPEIQKRDVCVTMTSAETWNVEQRIAVDGTISYWNMDVAVPVDVTAQVASFNSDGKCPCETTGVGAVVPIRNRIYVQTNAAILTLAQIVAATGGKVVSVTLKQVAGTGSVTADSGTGIQVKAGEVWDWGETYLLDGSLLSMNAGTGTQLITAIYQV